MQLAISNIAWCSKNDCLIYSKMKELGFTAVEIAPTRLLDKQQPYDMENIILAKEIIKKIKIEYDLAICSMQSILYGVNYRIFYGEEERMALLEYLKKAIYYASEIGCRNVVFGCPRNRNIIDMENQYQIGVEFFKSAAEFADKKNVHLSIEANPKIYKTNYINTTEEAIKLIKAVGNRSFGLNLDFGTIIQNNEDIEEIADYIQYINHVHVSEPFLEYIRERVKHKRLIEILKKYTYKHAVSIEMKKTNDICAIYKVMEYIASC